MESRGITHALLLLNAVLLLAVAFRPLLSPHAVAAQSASPGLFFEPGVFTLRAPDASRQVLGKVAVDLGSGTVWGFPTLTQDPYPANPLEQKPQVSHPF